MSENSLCTPGALHHRNKGRVWCTQTKCLMPTWWRLAAAHRVRSAAHPCINGFLLPSLGKELVTNSCPCKETLTHPLCDPHPADPGMILLNPSLSALSRPPQKAHPNNKPQHRHCTYSPTCANGTATHTIFSSTSMGNRCPSRVQRQHLALFLFAHCLGFGPLKPQGRH